MKPVFTLLLVTVAVAVAVAVAAHDISAAETPRPVTAHDEDILAAAARLGLVLGDRMAEELGARDFADLHTPRGVAPPTLEDLAERLAERLRAALHLLRELLDTPGDEDEDEDEREDGDDGVFHAEVRLLTADAVTGKTPPSAPIAFEHRKLYHEVLRGRGRLVIVAEGGAAVGAVCGQLLSLLSPEEEVAVVSLSSSFSSSSCYPNSGFASPWRLLAAAVPRKLSVSEEPPAAETARLAAEEIRRAISGYLGRTALICFCSESIAEIVEGEIEEDAEVEFSRWAPEDLAGERSPTEIASLILSSPTISRTTPTERPALGTPRRASAGGSTVVPLAIGTASGRVAVVDLHSDDLTEDLASSAWAVDGSRAFFVAGDGTLIGHSDFPAAESPTRPPRATSASAVEGVPFATEVWPEAISRPIGEKVVRSGGSGTLYSWRTAADCAIAFVAVPLDSDDRSAIIREDGDGEAFPRTLRHHRLDLATPSDAPLCDHLGRPSTVDRGALYLAPSAFASPAARKRHSGDTAETIGALMAYLKDPTGLLSNPGLRPGIREEAALAGRLLERARTRRDRGLGRYVVRRYAATSGGVAVAYPGSAFDRTVEPARSRRFVGAVALKSKTFYMPPTTDAGSVSVSFAPPRRSGPVVVLAADVTVGFLRRSLREAWPACFGRGARCFLMDDRGYLVYHPDLERATASGPVERRHVTHRESLVANDMLGRGELVEKKSCADLGGGVVQRRYSFNLSLVDSIGDSGPGDRCSKYSIAVVPGTGLFLGFVRSSCEMGAFCPCSVVDRLCLNCNRMERTECECPCECARSPTDDCADPVEETVCPFSPPRESLLERVDGSADFLSGSSPCFDFDCESRVFESECEGVFGCEWCRSGTDGLSELPAPFCSSTATCFGGVLGAAVPRVDGSANGVVRDDPFATYSAVGPVVGCVVALCLVLAVAVYCYRQNSDAEANDAFASPAAERWPDDEANAGRSTIEEDIREVRSGRREKLLAADGPSAPVSPYRIVTGYRRPNTAGESDHGYSTMTPHDDSEHLAFALAEPFLSKEDDSSGRNDSPTLSTPRSGVGDHPFTDLPCGKNNFLASVTVHRHMEAL